MKKALAVLFVVSICAAAAGQGKDTVAVYMAGKEPAGLLNVHKVMGGELERAISKSSKYLAVNRADINLALVAIEHKKQRDGSVDKALVQKVGKQFSVPFICIVEISPVNRAYYVTARLMNVVSAKVETFTEMSRGLEDPFEMMAVARRIALELTGVDLGSTQTASEPSGGNAAQTGNTFTDSRDGKVYKKVKIGTQTWMAENLNYNAKGSRCYDYNDSKCAKYGRLYNWSTAMNNAQSSSRNPSRVQGVCPAGWHLPSDAEWETLVKYVGGADKAGKKLKSKTGWGIAKYSSGDVDYNGSDEHGFSALPSGGGYYSNKGLEFYGSYDDGTDGNAHWQTSTEFSDDDAWCRCISAVDDWVRRYHSEKKDLTSVRCVQDGGVDLGSTDAQSGGAASQNSRTTAKTPTPQAPPPPPPPPPSHATSMVNRRQVTMATMRPVILQVQDAHKRRLSEKPGLKGEIKVKFSINGFGKVISAAVVESTINDTVFENRVVEIVKSSVFENIYLPGDVTTITFPFGFQ